MESIKFTFGLLCFQPRFLLPLERRIHYRKTVAVGRFVLRILHPWISPVSWRRGAVNVFVIFIEEQGSKSAARIEGSNGSFQNCKLIIIFILETKKFLKFESPKTKENAKLYKIRRCWKRLLRLPRGVDRIVGLIRARSTRRDEAT